MATLIGAFTSLNTIGLLAANLFSTPEKKPNRGLFSLRNRGDKWDGKTKNIIADVVISESHTDEMTITEHPIEQGASVADHAFKMAGEVTVELAWSSSPSGSGAVKPLRDIFDRLRDLQVNRFIFELETGKKIYKNMMCKSISIETNPTQEYALVAKLVCKEVFFARVSLAKIGLPAEQTKAPEKTGDTTDGGTKSLTPAPATAAPPI